MTGTAKRRRRIAGHVEQAIRELALEDYSVSQIAQELERRGERADDRTIRSIVAEVAPRAARPTDTWTLRDALPDDIALLMPVLQAVIERTGGRRDRLLLAEATWLARLRRAAPDLPLWNTYVLARLYVGAEQSAQPTQHLDALVAFAPWRSSIERDRYLEATRSLRIELLAVVPDLLAGRDAPIRVTPAGPGTWVIGGRRTGKTDKAHVGVARQRGEPRSSRRRAATSRRSSRNGG